MSEILTEASAARKYRIALKHLEYSGDLVSKLLKHSAKLEKIYAKLQDLQQRGAKESSYQKLCDILDDMQKWYLSAEVGLALCISK